VCELWLREEEMVEEQARSCRRDLIRYSRPRTVKKNREFWKGIDFAYMIKPFVHVREKGLS